MRTRSALERRWIVRFMTGPVLMVLLAGVVGHAQPGGLSSPEPPGAVTVPGRVVDGVTFVAAGALGVALGDVVTTAGDVLTWRGSEGVATFFLGSADALLQRPRNGGPDERALSAPPLLVPGGSQDDVGDWLLPLDAVQLVGVAADWVGGLVYLRLPGGENVVVAIVIDAVQDDASFLPAPRGFSEVSDVAGVPALRFFADDDLSLLLLDLDLAPLAYPELTDVIDAAAERAGSDQALLALVTSLSEREWSSALTFQQDTLTVEVRSYYRFHLYVGGTDLVSPNAPVAAVVLLPGAFSLYKPITVSWAGQVATVTFRH